MTELRSLTRLRQYSRAVTAPSAGLVLVLHWTMDTRTGRPVAAWRQVPASQGAGSVAPDSGQASAFTMTGTLGG